MELSKINFGISELQGYNCVLKIDLVIRVRDVRRTLESIEPIFHYDLRQEMGLE